ncbi:MAG: C-GCAxxG-C-C family protein, partial [Ruminococcus sp.]|nr:C-GCAxxG-C-C family protein [Ruminococcus sp.]
MENLRCEKAVEKKHNGYNCAQAVACSFCKEASMDEDTLKKITQGFGAGLGTMAGTCGAISGAAVVAGLINQDKAGTSQTVRSVMNQFKQQNGTVICKDLKGVETGKVIRSCDDCVRDAVTFLENALKHTPVYNFINDRLVDESAVLRPLSWHLILYVFRY